MHESGKSAKRDFAVQHARQWTRPRARVNRYGMPTELKIFAWGCLLAFIHIMATAQVRTRQYGTKWNMGARDETLPPALPVVGRLERAQANFFETFPILIASILLITALGLSTPRTALGAWLWLGGRIVYLPLYALGVPIVRSLAWAVSVVGIVMVLWPALAASFS